MEIILNSTTRWRLRAMHVTIGLTVLLASFKWANWKDWERYYPTILYVIASNLLYKFFALSKFHLWKLSSQDFFFNSHLEVYLWHTIFINSLLTFIYLSNFPEQEIKGKVFYILKWTTLFILMEIIMLTFNHIHYHNGWNLAWTTCFDIVMFCMLRLHFQKPLWAIILSVPSILFYLIVFGYF
jgi:hypothetical protein